MSPFERSFSRWRLPASATPLFAIGPVKIVCEKTLDASSISFENVYANENVRPREKRFSSFAWSAL